MPWPACDSDHELRCSIAGHEPIVTVLLRDLESRSYEQQFELRREVDMAGEIGHEALGERVFGEPVVDLAHIGALQVRLVCGRRTSEQPSLCPEARAGRIDI